MVRTNNEDAVHVEVAPAWSVAVLADGMGGYRAGEVASALAVQSIAQSLQRSALKSATPARPPRMAAVHRALEHCVQAANTAVRAHASHHAECQGMGTTVVAAVFTQGRLVLAHLGDSRAYLWRRGTLAQLTSDHSWLQEQLDTGQISADAAAQSGLGHLITRALGVSDSAQPTLREEPLEAGDRILLCSDGLSDLLSAGEIAALLAMPEPLARQVEQLIARANALGGHDNISVILASVEAAPAD
ncbi:PP2C family serine/threonine-protein phosphatase [Pantoea sp. 18069]|uniref:PP2C family protein-serine/threonine phosphatase n=1 Tax=Pantoea sp. 18069 TaxID=2681415 RepID=UPI001357F7E2|nr:PP2C family serine/threonine-protein phosphatase [Pantoea sp. 18069]